MTLGAMGGVAPTFGAAEVNVASLASVANVVAAGEVLM
jgi:hypothetical protein